VRSQREQEQQQVAASERATADASHVSRSGNSAFRLRVSVPTPTRRPPSFLPRYRSAMQLALRYVCVCESQALGEHAQFSGEKKGF